MTRVSNLSPLYVQWNIPLYYSAATKTNHFWKGYVSRNKESLTYVKGRIHFPPYRYVSLRLRVQNRRKKWNFPLNFRTMCKLSDLYSGIFQTQSSGCASGVDLFRNFTKLKILNIWIVKYLLNCKRYLSYNFRIFQKISECWVLENLDVHLEQTTSDLEF